MSGRRPLVVLEITTRTPEKWRLVDTETGEVWRWRTPDDPPGPVYIRDQP